MTFGVALLACVLAHAPLGGWAVRVSEVSEALSLGSDFADEHGVLDASTNDTLEAQCEPQLRALEESIAARTQLAPGALRQFFGSMKGLRAMTAEAYGMPTDLVKFDCDTLISGVFETTKRGWYTVEQWKGQCKAEGSCFTEGLSGLGLTADMLTDKDWAGFYGDAKWVTEYASHQEMSETCGTYCSALKWCRECSERAVREPASLYGDPNAPPPQGHELNGHSCRRQLISMALCTCGDGYASFMKSQQYADALRTLGEATERDVRRKSDDDGIMNRECKDEKEISGNYEVINGVKKAHNKLYLPHLAEGAFCNPGYSCQPSRVWRNQALGHYAAPILVGVTYGLMKAAEFTIVVALSHVLCGPGWVACWTTYATSVPASEVAIFSVVGASKGILSREALACLPTRCTLRGDRCEVPGEPSDHRALIQGVRCRVPTEAEREAESEAEGEHAEDACVLEFCPIGATANGPQPDGSLWHCEQASRLDPESSLLSRAKRLRRGSTNMCVDGGVDVAARGWFQEQFQAFSSARQGCISSGHFMAGVEPVPGDEPDFELAFELFESVRLRRGYVCAEGSHSVHYLRDSGCLKQSMVNALDPSVVARTLWGRHQGAPWGKECRRALAEVVLCACAFAYEVPVTARPIASKAAETMGQAAADYENFLEGYGSAERRGRLEGFRSAAAAASSS